MIVFGTETFLNLSGSMGNSLWKHSETGYDSAKGGNKMLQEISVKETNGHCRLDNFTNGEPNSVVTIAKELGPRFAARAARADEGDLFVAENFGEPKLMG